MLDHEFALNKEPLWAIPAGVMERLRRYPHKSDYDNFRLSALYSTVAVFFLLLFGLSALTEGNTTHAAILFAFAAAAIIGLCSLWLGEWYWLGRHFTTAMMGLLCLYLFHSGGVQNTGPLYYGVYPSVALFLQGRLRGFIWVIALLLLTVLIWHGALGFDVNRYSNVFVARVIGITLIISILTCIPEYFRLKAERDLLLSINDLESLTYGDLATRLANRNFLEKILHNEFSRHQRYGSDCCLMFVEQDVPARSAGQDGDVDEEGALLLVADALRRNLRMQDVAGRWERKRFLLVLPEITLEGAMALAVRLLAEIRTQGTGVGRFVLPATASIGIAVMNRQPEHEVLLDAMNNLLAAQRQGGDCYASG